MQVKTEEHGGEQAALLANPAHASAVVSFAVAYQVCVRVPVAIESEHETVADAIVVECDLTMGKPSG